MTHAEMNEVYELYALGVLEPEMAAEIERHLAEACEYCGEHVRAAAEMTAALAHVAEQAELPARLRERVVGSVTRQERRSRGWVFATAGMAAACVALIVYAALSGVEMRQMEARLGTLRAERDQLRAAVEILSRPETRAVEFGGTGNVAHGRVLVNRNGGFVFAGSQLPPIASDRTFELWLVPASGAAPQPAGLFRPDGVGQGVHVSSTAVDAAAVKAVAVSVEPLGGSSAPTTKPFLIVPLG
jgi:anti-sigma-K factor RskA